MSAEAARRFLESANGRVGILFDEDADGISSAALLLLFFGRKGVITSAMSAKLEKKYFDEFAAKDFDFYVVVDLPVDQYLGHLKSLEGKRVLFIDHHPVTNDLNRHGFVYFNPRLQDPDAYVCTAHNVFNLLKGHLEGNEWLMKIGAVGDHEIEGSDEDAEASGIVDAVVATKKPAAYIKLAVFLSRCKRVEDFLYDGNYRKIKETFDRELDRQIAKYEVETSGNLTFFEVKCRYNLTAILSTRLFALYPRRTLVLYTRKSGNTWSVSGRSHDYDMGAAFRKASEGIGGGGGHPVAAGAYVNDFKLFKKRLLELLK